ncbi:MULTISPECIES: hypothetical protein [unclassified Bradyrhizobium]|uniref:hypothetical protein n=1 Tax=unclassified Bradyrhizobium TaxID=2631580 RepID=UPI0028EF6ECD|nr:MULTISPECIES: hypothetical protein [unclassified Bradyrhizobium]
MRYHIELEIEAIERLDLLGCMATTTVALLPDNAADLGVFAMAAGRPTIGEDIIQTLDVAPPQVFVTQHAPEKFSLSVPRDHCASAGAIPRHRARLCRSRPFLQLSWSTKTPTISRSKGG